jgi:hypothetical protein
MLKAQGIPLCAYLKHFFCDSVPLIPEMSRIVDANNIETSQTQ